MATRNRNQGLNRVGTTWSLEGESCGIWFCVTTVALAWRRESLAKVIDGKEAAVTAGEGTERLLGRVALATSHQVGGDVRRDFDLAGPYLVLS